jgi:hypothetical protein
VFVFWDLDNKRCRGQAERVLGNIRRVAGAFGRVALLRAYGNQTTMQERYRALPVPGRCGRGPPSCHGVGWPYPVLALLQAFSISSTV